jgi:hypothetical protein
MSNKHRHGAPEAAKASSAPVTQTGPTVSESPATGAELQGVTLTADGVERTVHLDPNRRKPLPEGAVVVEALVGVVVRVQHRNPGDRFWLLKSRPEDDTNPLSEYADEFVARGDVEIL